MWNYKKKGNTEGIKKSLKSVNWKTLFNNKTVNKQVSTFNETIINIFSNFVSNKLVTVDDPPWMSDFIKNKIKWKHQIHKIYQKNGHKDSGYLKLQEATSVVSELISRRKEKYQNHLALKLNDPMTNAKTYWSLLKTFYNGKKVPIISPLLTDNNIISDLEAKANHFNNFFCVSMYTFK